MLGNRLRPLVDLVAEPQRPLADHRLFGVVVVVERRRRAARLGGDVGDGGGQDAFAGDDSPGGGVDGGLRPATAVRRQRRTMGRLLGDGGHRRPSLVLTAGLPRSREALELWNGTESDVRFRFGSPPRNQRTATPTDGSPEMIKPHNVNSEFELGGINHVALVCSDMARTVDFYSNVLGMPLIKSLDLPGGSGQHFFFDAGNGDCVAFFWFTDAPDRVPGISSPAAIPGIGEITSAVSTMNHLAFHVPAEKFDAYRQRLKDKGVRVGPVLNHDESERQGAATVHPGVYVRSFYFQDPDGITLEFASWVKEFTEGDARAVPKTASDRRPAVEVVR